MMKSSQWKKIFLCYLCVLIFFLLCKFSPFSVVCDFTDQFIFRFLNESLRDHLIWRSCWAVMNWEGERIISLIPLGLIYVWYFKTLEQKERIERIFHIIGFFSFCCLALLISRIIMHNGLHLRRLSPSLVFHDCIRLSHYFPQFAIKDSSRASFPGDHTAALILWGSYLIFYAPKKFKMIALVLIFLLSLPRLFAGAHWLSDDIVGSVCLALIILAWVFYTPIAQKIAQALIYLLKEKWKWKILNQLMKKS